MTTIGLVVTGLGVSSLVFGGSELVDDAPRLNRRLVVIGAGLLGVAMGAFHAGVLMERGLSGSPLQAQLTVLGILLSATAVVRFSADRAMPEGAEEGPGRMVFRSARKREITQDRPGTSRLDEVRIEERIWRQR